MSFDSNIDGNSAMEREQRWGEANTAAVSIPSELGFEGINHIFDGAPILNDISLTAGSGTVTCLLGPSGSGKTTLLRIAAGLVRQTSGKMLLNNREIAGDSTFLAPEQRGIGLVFQDYALFPHLTLLQNVSFGLKHLKRTERAPLATLMLRRVGLGDRALDFPHHLSGGEQQRVALARAMAPRPGVLLMDEPFSGLDSRLRDFVREETMGVLRETRATALIVTHDPEEALRMGDQIALLHKGRLEQAGTGRDLFYRPKSLFAAGFFSEINTFRGKVHDGAVDTPLGPISLSGVAEGTNAVAAIRSVSINVQPAKKKSAKAGSLTTGRIVNARFTGEHDHIQIGVSGAQSLLRAKIDTGVLPPAALEGREDVSLSIDQTGAFAFPV